MKKDYGSFIEKDDSSQQSESPRDSNQHVEIIHGLNRVGLDENELYNPDQQDLPLLTNPKNQQTTVIPEITPRAVVLVLILSILLSAADIYIGLFAGITISVSIPSAILSIGLLKSFDKQTSILEINCIQTGVSAGASLSSGIIYTLPALTLLNSSGQASKLEYQDTLLIALVGGILGIMFSIPLRRALIIEEQLTYPEGVATAQVLKVTHVSKNRKWKILLIVLGASLGALIKLGESGFRWWASSLQGAWVAAGAIIYIGCHLSPALVAVGYIIRLKMAFLMFLGAILNWWIIIPIVSKSDPNLNLSDPLEAAFAIWNKKTRFIGVGAMLFGGLVALITLSKPLWRGIKTGMDAYRVIHQKGMNAILRTERDIPLPFIIICDLFLMIPLAIIYGIFTENVGATIMMTCFCVFAGFIFASIGAYMAGVVGSSNNPISGVTIATILTIGGLLRIFYSSSDSKGPAACILVGAVICSATGISGDNMQDLKTGYLIGSTPIKLQIMQIVGIIGPSLLIAPIINLLIQAYGIGEGNYLSAPQATLMKSISISIFEGSLPVTMILIGVLLAVPIFIADLFTNLKWQIRIPVLSTALGLYLPFELSTPIFLGGFISWLSIKTMEKLDYTDHQSKLHASNGLLFAAGLITGEALIGILIAIPIVISNDPNVLAFAGDFSNSIIPGILLLLFVLIAIYIVVIQRKLVDLSEQL